ncbi:hypothetical protein [Chelativorans sp. M5D2P16]|uniref:PQQ-dependent sugar dehydrogenase n=1 Tax=Chelativorans sp. M5D2P16 TaxID=3095678 RepID=UPI002ACA40B3|nr:hypothetical protein [Chelativorans sp. M5D2P16]MDZ5698637.1 hypothetical protein [Chelativorans sp. M5D2P16]
MAAAHAQDQGADQQTGPSWQDTISVARPGESGTLPGGPSIELREVTGDFIDPVNVVSAKDGTGRNPETGGLYIAEVGQNHWEEINFQPADSQGGENYGWDFLMGTHCFPIEQEECPQVGVLPVAEYDHEQGCSAIGLGVYRGGEIEDLDGVYLAGDYCAGTIWGLARGEDDQWVFQELLASGVQLTGGGTDADGNLYVTSCNCNYGGPLPQENPPGTLWQVVAASDQDSDTNGTAVAASRRGTSLPPPRDGARGE